MSTILTGTPSNVTTPLSAAITSLANNGSGAIRVATSTPHLFGNGDALVQLSSFGGGLSSLNGTVWVIAVIDPSHFDLVGSTFTSSGTGVATDYSITPSVQVPTDGDPFSAQLSGLLSAYQALLDRTQWLAQHSLDPSTTPGGPRNVIASAVTISGSVAVIGTGAFLVQKAAGVFVTVAGGITTIAAGAIQPGVASGIQSNVLHGISAGVAGGIFDGGTAGGIVATVPGGISDGGTAGGIAATVTNGISSKASGGGIALDGGTNDWIQLSPSGGGRSLSIVYPLLQFGSAAGWFQFQGGITGPGTTTQAYFPIIRPYPGATINSVSLIFKVSGPHSVVPANFPKLEVYMFSLIAGSPPAQLWLSSTHSKGPTAGSGAAWDASGNLQSYTYTCDQNNTNIDTTQTMFAVQLTDENGANSVAGNLYYALEVSYNITAQRMS